MSSRKIFTTLGASNHAIENRGENDYYATSPEAIKPLLEKQQFSKNIWECACGELSLSNELKKHGFNVYSTDIIDRGVNDDTFDFLKCDIKWDGDIITNPPYKYALEFLEKSLKCINVGNKVAFFLKIQFLESQKRRLFFDKNPPKKVLVFSKRIACYKNGDFDKYESSAICYAWFIWEKGFTGKPIIEWI